MTDNYNQEKKKYDMVKLTLNEFVDKLDRTSDQYNVVLKENEKLKSDVKSMQADNALLFKKVVSLQDQLMEYYNHECKVSNKSKQDSVDEDDEKLRAKRIQSCILPATE